MRGPSMRNVIRVSPRNPPPALEKCPHCGSPDVELRPDGALQCGKCFYTTKPTVNASLLQSWAPSIFSLRPAEKVPADMALGGRVASLGGVLLLAGIVLALLPWTLGGNLGRLLTPPPPSSLALAGGTVIVGVLGGLALFAGYTMANGDPKAWRALLLAGLLGLLLGFLGPGGFLGVVGGALAVVASVVGRE